MQVMESGFNNTSQAKSSTVVLVDSGYDGESRKARAYPHLGLAYLGAVLEEHNYAVQIIDRQAKPLSVAEVAEEVRRLGAACVGITGATSERFLMQEILQEIKKLMPDVLTIGGGPHYSYSAVDAIEKLPCIDVVCVGEGEITLVELLERFLRTEVTTDFSGIAGCVYRSEDGSVISNELRPRITDLDTLPFPAWHLFDMEHYRFSIVDELPQLIGVGVISSRGCPYSCSFCSNSLSKKVYYMSPERFVDMLEALISRYGYNSFAFNDDSFTAKVSHAADICHEILRRGLKISWSCTLNVNQVAKDFNLLKLMKEAGCVCLGFGIEFPDNEVLLRVNKRATVEMQYAALNNIRKIGFAVQLNLFFMNSLPGQSLENTVGAAYETIKMKRLFLPAQELVAHFGAWARINPGTVLEVEARKSGLLPEGFSWNQKSSMIGLRQEIHQPLFENPNLTISDLEGVYAVIIDFQKSLDVLRLTKQEFVGLVLSVLEDKKTDRHLVRFS